MQEQRQQSNPNKQKKYFTQIPNIIDNLELSPRAYRLYGHLKTIFGVNYTRACTQAQERLAVVCRMSKGSIGNAKKELIQKGLIEIDIVKTTRGNKHSIRGVNIEKKNEEFFQKAIEEGHTPFSSKIIEPSTRIKPLGRNQSIKRTKAYKDEQKAIAEAARLEAEQAARRKKIINVKISDSPAYNANPEELEIPFDVVTRSCIKIKVTGESCDSAESNESDESHNVVSDISGVCAIENNDTIQTEKEKTPESDSGVLKKYYFNLNKNCNTSKAVNQLVGSYHTNKLNANSFTENPEKSSEYFSNDAGNPSNFQDEFSVSPDDEEILQKLETQCFDQFRSFSMDNKRPKVGTEEYNSFNNKIILNNTFYNLDSALASSKLDESVFSVLLVTKAFSVIEDVEQNLSSNKRLPELDWPVNENSLQNINQDYLNNIDFYLTETSEIEETDINKPKVNIINNKVKVIKTERREQSEQVQVLDLSTNNDNVNEIERSNASRSCGLSTKEIKVKTPKVKVPKEPKPPRVLSIKAQLEQKKRDNYTIAKKETKNKVAEKNFLMKVIDKAHKGTVNFSRQSRWVTLLVWKYNTDDCVNCLASLMDNWRVKGEDIRFRPDWLSVWKGISEWQRRKAENIPMRKETYREQKERHSQETKDFTNSLSIEEILRIRGKAKINVNNLFDKQQLSIKNDENVIDISNLATEKGEVNELQQQNGVIPESGKSERLVRVSPRDIPNEPATPEQARGFLSKLRESANSAKNSRKDS